MPTATEPTVDTDIPAGNAVIEQVDGDTIHLRPDLRDTEGHWFYWHVRVRHAGGHTLRFQFPNNQCIGARGPAISIDAGRTWRWLTDHFPHADHFDYAVPDAADDVRLCMTIPYGPEHLDAFLATRRASNLVRETLCTSHAGHAVPLLRAGNLSDPDTRILVTARHHACESMASFVLEGLLAAALADDELGHWFQHHVELMCVPFVDHDGVMHGDQGKNRAPHDHNRDYAGDSIHAEVAAIRELVPRWSAGRLRVGLDLHCPYLRNNVHGHGQNEKVYQVGGKDPARWGEQQRFGGVLEQCAAGALPYAQANDLPFGQDWNTGANYGQFKSSTRWFAEQPGVRLTTTFEIPYANAQGVEVHIEPCRALGRDIAQALRSYLAG
ncbi:MAG: hypothetical protein WD009_13855 [Phycisphaeraceae bacterium]